MQKNFFADNKYKVELIDESPEGETITAYRHGDFVDLCRGPHEHKGTGSRVQASHKVAGGILARK